MSKILQHILTLKRGVTPYGKAPHKPVLLLAVIDLFEAGEVYENWMEITIPKGRRTITKGRRAIPLGKAAKS